MINFSCCNSAKGAYTSYAHVPSSCRHVPCLTLFFILSHQQAPKQHHTESTQCPQPSPPLSLSSQAKSPNKSALQYAKYLRAFYQSRALPVDTKWPPTPSKRYINLAIIQREPANREEAYELTSARFFGNIDEILKCKKPIALEKFFQPEGNKQLKCILVEGSPGVGKSTFSWKICRQWEEMEALKHFTLVILSCETSELVRHHHFPILSITVTSHSKKLLCSDSRILTVKRRCLYSTDSMSCLLNKELLILSSLT